MNSDVHITLEIRLTFLPTFSITEDATIEPMNCKTATIKELTVADKVDPASSKMEFAYVSTANTPIKHCTVIKEKHTKNALNVGRDVTENKNIYSKKLK